MTWNFGDNLNSILDADPMHSMLSDWLSHSSLDGLDSLDQLASHANSGFETHPLFSHDLGGGHPASSDLGHHPFFSNSKDHHSDIMFGTSSDKSDDNWRDEMNAKHYAEEAKRDAEKAEQALKDNDPDKAAMHLRWSEREVEKAKMHRDFIER